MLGISQNFLTTVRSSSPIRPALVANQVRFMFCRSMTVSEVLMGIALLNLMRFSASDRSYATDRID